MSLTSDDERLEYVKIANDLREQILTGSLAPGDKLPTARQLMKTHGVATHTVTSALRLLQAEKLTYSVHGRGTYVREDLDLSEQRLGNGSPNPLDDPADQLREAVNRIEAKLDRLIEEVAAINKRIND